MINALTIDVEEHYHVCGLTSPLPVEELAHATSRVVPQTHRMLDLLSRRHVKATFFILGSVAERYPELVRHIAQEGHELATHGYRHELVYRQTRLEFADDLRRALEQLTGVSARPILGYRAPSFSITRRSLWAFEVLAELGFRYDCSIFPIHHPRYGIPDAPRVPHVRNGLTEFPLSTLRCGPLNVPVAGGAYFRLLPLSFLLRAYRRLNRQGIPVQLYVHPWELDQAIPRLAIPWHRAVTHYTNLRQTSARLSAVLDQFDFGPVHQVLGLDAS